MRGEEDIIVDLMGLLMCIYVNEYVIEDILFLYVWF